jgi:translation elongation factor EF-4
VIQVFYPEIGEQWIVGVVGQLQLEVLISRLEAEYKVEAVLEARRSIPRAGSGSGCRAQRLYRIQQVATSPRTATATRCYGEIVVGCRLSAGTQPGAGLQRHQGAI